MYVFKNKGDFFRDQGFQFRQPHFLTINLFFGDFYFFCQLFEDQVIFFDHLLKLFLFFRRPIKFLLELFYYFIKLTTTLPLLQKINHPQKSRHPLPF